MNCFLVVFQALAELCEIKFGKTHPVCSLVSKDSDKSRVRIQFAGVIVLFMHSSLLWSHNFTPATKLFCFILFMTPSLRPALQKTN